MAIHLRYIGKKPRYTDHLYGTGIIWQGSGDICPVDNQTGAKMLLHTDVFEPATKAEYDALNGTPAALQDLAQLGVIPSAMPRHPRHEEEPPQPAALVSRTTEQDEEPDADRRIDPVNIAALNKVQLREYAKRTYNKDFPEEMTHNAMRKAVTEIRRGSGILGT